MSRIPKDHVFVNPEIRTGRKFKRIFEHVKPGILEKERVSDCLLEHSLVGALMKFWGNAQTCGHENGDDLVLPWVHDEGWIDSISGVDGLADAMQKVGWLDWSNGCAVLPNYFENECYLEQ